MSLNVNRHTGGLEMLQAGEDVNDVVNRHTGGLEIILLFDERC